MPISAERTIRAAIVCIAALLCSCVLLVSVAWADEVIPQGDDTPADVDAAVQGNSPLSESTTPIAGLSDQPDLENAGLDANGGEGDAVPASDEAETVTPKSTDDGLALTPGIESGLGDAKPATPAANPDSTSSFKSGTDTGAAQQAAVQPVAKAEPVAVKQTKTASKKTTTLTAQSSTKAQSSSKAASTPKADVANGVYMLRNAKSKKVLDVADGSLAKKANVQQYAKNSGYGQRFYLESNGKGFYRIFNVGSGLALTVAGDAVTGSNVYQNAYIGAKTQLWSLIPNSDGTFSLVSKANDLALVVAGGSKKNGANIQVAKRSSSKVQRFSLMASSLLSDGAVTLFSAASAGRAVTVSNASTKSGAALRLSKYAKSPSQKAICDTADSGLTLREVCSGLYVTGKGSKVSQAKSEAIWEVAFAAKGKRRGIVLAAPSGKVLTASSSSNNAKLVLSKANGKSAQSFLPRSVNLVTDGVYVIKSVASGKALDVDNGGWKNGTNIQVWKSTGVGAQAFHIESVDGTYYRITNALSGKVLDVAGGSKKSGANVQLYKSNGTAAQLWKPVWSDSGFIMFVNKNSGKVLDVAGGSTANGANVQVYSRNDTDSQGWRLKESSYTPDKVLQDAYGTVENLSSSTSYLIAVDRDNTRVVVFEGSAGNWAPIHNWTVSVGAPDSPTVSGDFTVASRGYSFGDGFTCYYWTQFYGDYLFHSVLYNEGTRTIQDGRLGYKISHGCVRMDIDNAKWIYDNIPSGTRVRVYN